MLIVRVSKLTGKRHEMEIPVTEHQMKMWESGVLAQDAFPGLTPDEREFIITGITPEEWMSMVGDDEYDIEME